MSAIVVLYTFIRKKRIMLPLESGEKVYLADETLEGAVEYE
jgi:hypothetical protein